ncbi:ketopantoate reductase family protein [Bacillus sp. 1P06AnD]|uniref:ketopantoate reductase family protein n=1 Tax=Bacillus sp. 1P06AnD TaxID=3132208 RepID=UPI0039A3986F
MAIKKVSIIGLGALGILFGQHLSKRMDKEDVRIIADRKRIERYERDKVYCNGEECFFRYVLPEEKCEPADLLIFAVKDNGLDDAIRAVKNHVGEHTAILSLLNGISSEERIGAAFGFDKVLYSVAQGMDAVKVGNRLTYDHMGMICFGDKNPAEASQKAKDVAAFFEEKFLPHEWDRDMYRRQWGKFMLNVGVNQTAAVYKSNYGEVQREGIARDTMIAAMREVMALSEKEGVYLTEEDLEYWLYVLSTLSPNGKPSMAQDVEAERFSEVALFAGTVVEIGRKHELPTPVNEELLEKIRGMESEYPN